MPFVGYRRPLLTPKAGEAAAMGWSLLVVGLWIGMLDIVTVCTGIGGRG